MGESRFHTFRSIVCLRATYNFNLSQYLPTSSPGAREVQINFNMLHIIKNIFCYVKVSPKKCEHIFFIFFRIKDGGKKGRSLSPPFFL
jgi:hypothetical protein